MNCMIPETYDIVDYLKEKPHVTHGTVHCSIIDCMLRITTLIPIRCGPSNKII